ncbi:MAG: hypothetical protein J1G06_06695 [Oscillospiraceae bacterium]|nr:hypothetical protein [Oscillospiraceae bacterium]
MSKQGNMRGRSSRNLKKESGFLPRAVYSSETAKYYIMATIIIFHILPLVLKLCGPIGQSLLNTNVRIYVNPMAVLAILLVYGIKLGFNVKMPLFVTFLSAASTIMYYTIEIDRELGILYYYFLSFGSCFIIYGIMAFMGVFFGSLIKRLKIF